MDVNRTRFHLLAGDKEFSVAGSGLAWHAQGCLALAPDHRPRWPEAARDTEAGPAWVRDRFGQHARIEAILGRTIEHDAAGDWAALTIDDADGIRELCAPAGIFVDLAMGGPPGEERLAALWRDGDAHGVVLFHLRTRWHFELPIGMRAERLLVDGSARLWIAGPDGVVRVEGEPLPLPYRPQLAAFEPERIVPNPPRVTWPPEGPLAIPGLGGRVRGLATDGASLYLLGGVSNEPVVFVRPLESGPDADWKPHTLGTIGIPLPLSDLAVVAPGRVALLADFAGDPLWTRRDCPVVILADGAQPAPTPERYPFVERPDRRFVATADGTVRWRGERGGVQPLQPLAVARFASEGEGRLLAPLDSAMPQCVWHKIVLEARIPPSTRLLVDVRAADTPEALDKQSWEEQPPPTWMPIATELPWAEASVAQRDGEAGSFEILLQREKGNVRRIVGRHLQVRLHFHGDGRTTPALRRLRVHFPRFSYQEQYLPAHLRQMEAQVAGPARANGADFRERLLAVFEGLFTPIEDRVAAAELLVDPASCPEALLANLAGLVGFPLDPSMPLDVRRRLVAGIGGVALRRGTLLGVAGALDLVTGDAVRRGRIVLVENHRLRRTFATLLGLEIDDSENALTLGTMHSGNSIVGDSLILSHESARALLAAIDPSLASADDRTAAQAFFDRWAHQVTVILHGDAKALRPGIERVLAREMPAHVQWQIVVTDHSFVLGLSPLLAVDTVLDAEPSPEPVVLDRTRLSREGLLADAAALSPHHVHSTDRT